MSDWKDEFGKVCYPVFKKEIRNKFGGVNEYHKLADVNVILKFIESLLSKQLEELVEKVEGLKSVELPDGQIIISKDQVIALIKGDECKQ